MFLYPTLMDSFGLVVAESIACGCPVVTFQTWWVPEIVTHKKNGYIAQYKNYADLLSWFNWVLHNPLDKVTLDPKFTQEHMVKEYIQLYKSQLGLS
jgi:glycosyltransferase involved in cell wall biosynthesis